MSPEQITERLEALVDTLCAAADQIDSLRKSLSGSVLLEDIRSDLRLGKADSEVRAIYRHILATLEDDLPAYFDRMRKGEA